MVTESKPVAPVTTPVARAPAPPNHRGEGSRAVGSIIRAPAVVILRVCDFFKSPLEPTLITNELGCSKTHENQKSHKL